MTWFSTFIEWLASWWPFTKVETWERAVRFTYMPRRLILFDLNTKRFCWYFEEAHVIETELGPGMHRSVKWFEEIMHHSTVEDTFELEIQNITTKDLAPVTFRVSGVFEVFNVSNASTKVNDYERSIKNLAMIHMARVIRTHEFNYAIANTDEIEQNLRAELHEKSKKWGIRIKDIGLTTLVKTHQYTKFQISQ